MIALYALGRLADAADALETGPGTIHERLFEAFTYPEIVGHDAGCELARNGAARSLVGRLHARLEVRPDG